jgi:hypothetical protein
MTDSITPPPELVQQWRAASSNVPATLSTETEPRRDYIDYIAARAAQWGADKELEACCEWLHDTWVEDPEDIVPELRADRRPKPLSPAAQTVMDAVFDHWPGGYNHPGKPRCVAAALRAAADQVVPKQLTIPDGDLTEQTYRWDERSGIRNDLLAIAAELENHQ